MKIFFRLSRDKALGLLVFTLFSFTSLFSQTNAPSIKTGVSFQWSDVQTTLNDPATIQSITVGTRVFVDFGSPQSYTMTQVGTTGGNAANRVRLNNTLVESTSASPTWDASALAAFQDKNLNHFFEASNNGQAICNDFSAAQSTLIAQKQTFSYSPAIRSTSGSIIAITERNANNCYHIEFFGTPVGGGANQSLGSTFVNPQGPTYYGHGGTGSSSSFGTVGTVVAPTSTSDYWLSDRVVVTNGGTIGIALFYVNDIAPQGSFITDVRITATSADHGDGKLFIFSLPDEDGDGFSDIDDLDDDDDGILDIDESNGYSPSYDEDGDGIPNWNDTIDNGTGDGSFTNYADANGDGVPDVYDFDGDGIPNHLDFDSDNDGCFDALEGGDGIVTTELNPNGSLNGDIDAATGVPNNVNVNNGQTIGTSQNASAYDANGQCDRDNDGVLDGSDICQGSDDSVDIDNDGVPNGCDLDNDNDGILDINEGVCSSQILTGVWTISGNTASYDFGNGIIAEVSTSNENNFTSGVFTNGAFWTENLANAASLQNQYIWNRTLTVNYVDQLGDPITVTNPIIFLDRVGGTDGLNDEQNTAIVTLQNGLTWTALSGTSDFGSTATTVFDSGTGTAADPAHVQDATQNDADGTAAGTMQINGEVSTFTLQFVQGGLFGTGTDGIEFILSACQSLDTDNDGTPDYLDTDSDNDGCFDAIEGGDNIALASVNTDGTLNGTINTTTGVANNVNTTSGQSIGGASDASLSDPNGQCDSDGDGVIDNLDVCPGSDDTADNDNDNVPDGCDLDDDNDGILDINEQNVITCTNEESPSFGAAQGPNNYLGSDINNPEVGDSFLYNNVYTGVDAIVTIVSSNDNDILVLDVTTTGTDSFFQPQIDHASATSYTEFKIDFVVAGTTTPAPVSTYILTTIDNDVFEFVTYADGFASDVYVDTPTNEIAYSGNPANLDGFTRGYVSDGTFIAGVDVTTPQYQVAASYSLVSSVSFRFGDTSSNTSNHSLSIEPCIPEDNWVTVPVFYEDIDTDGDGIPNSLDNDSDGDMCPDAIEGGGTLNSTNVDANGQLTGTVDSTTGVPNDVDVNAGQTVGDSTNDLVNACLGSVSGTIVDENGDPVSGIVVTLDDGDAATVDPTVTTGVDGTYEFTDVPVGDYTIVQTVPANTEVVDGDTTDDSDTVANTDTTDGSIPVTVEAGEVDADNNFENSPAPGSVSGTIVDENGDPVSGIVVTLDDGDAATVDPTVTTGVDGTYEFTDVPVGEYTIVQTVPANTDVVDGDTTDDSDTVANTDTTDGSIPVTVEAGEVDADNNFENSPTPGSVSGTIVDENGDPVSGIVVTLDDGDAATVDPTVTTGVDGTYEFTDVPVGDYTVVETIPANTDVVDGDTTDDSDTVANTDTTDGSIPVTVEAGEVDADNNFENSPAPGSVSGTIVDENGDPVSGIVVTLDDGDAATVDPTVTTGVDGTYEFTDVPVGDYTIVQTVPANTEVVDGDTTDDSDTVANTDTTDGSIPVTVEAGEVDADNNFENSPAPGSVSGTIVDENGDPVSGIVVTLDDGDAATVDPTVTTGVDGTYEFTDVPVGDYTVVETIPANTDVVDGDTTDDSDTVANTDTTDGSIPVTVEAGEVDADNNFENSPAPGSVSGTIVDENGDPVSGIVVTLDDGDAATVDPTVTTGVDGTY
ncbi:carboxypeptidase regulatory-like domain-containing protein, partial [Olleya sp.]|uniref:carboxypeptidase regulatory-like domain-containing protein n=1 Tax=Olleya sp. TaxID=1906788 RepID=UPI0032D90B44